MKYKIISFLFCSMIYSQCSELDNTQCNSNDNCNWNENITQFNCSNFSSSSLCDNYAEYGCSWEWSWGGWMNSGSSCVGGFFEIDNGNCEEIIMPTCSELGEIECSNNNECEWTEDISYGNCGNLTVQECYNYPGECYVDSLPGWYDSSGPYCTGGTYQIDNSYCEEIIMPTCSELGELPCYITVGCDWVEDLEYANCAGFNTNLECSNVDCDWVLDIQYGSCSQLSESACDSNPDCYYDCEFYHGSCAGCCWGSCLGGTYVQSDNSYCEGLYEIDNGYCQDSYMLGDMNFDGIINIQDVIQSIDLIMNQEYNEIADMNNDGNINVQDIIWIIDIILNGEI